ncbi:hypothetical protein [Salinisphaera sp. Q1T1-3]|uniref:hypothetical protein n=1 Tax=Salinisphaera sp. Q1T1-3 TaxID=2321229 RepID=UPI000E768A43|nr:hypothetical protein [Salinisphaera sp. Q1T1-3]RJS94124.1 hypothetical protein D3260_06070 [Salinisphaera sp. Q1T1-3]
MRLITVFFILAAASAICPVAFAQGSDNAASETEARQAWQAKRDALAEQRLGGASEDKAAKRSATEAMLNSPIRTDDATPVPDDNARRNNR